MNIQQLGTELEKAAIDACGVEGSVTNQVFRRETRFDEEVAGTGPFHGWVGLLQSHLELKFRLIAEVG